MKNVVVKNIKVINHFVIGEMKIAGLTTGKTFSLLMGEVIIDSNNQFMYTYYLDLANLPDL